MTEFEWALFCNGEFVAGGSCADLNIARVEGRRYFDQYEADGACRLTIYEKKVVEVIGVTNA